MDERGPNPASYSVFQCSLFLAWSFPHSRHQISTCGMSCASPSFTQPVVVFLCLRNLVAQWCLYLSLFFMTKELDFWKWRSFWTLDQWESERRWVMGSDECVGRRWEERVLSSIRVAHETRRMTIHPSSPCAPNYISQAQYQTPSIRLDCSD